MRNILEISWKVVEGIMEEYEPNGEIYDDQYDPEKTDDESDHEAEEMIALISQKGKTKKRGRQSDWPEKFTNDLIDVILSDENLKRKLILTNVKTVKNGASYSKVVDELKKRHDSFSYTVPQTRTKFKRCLKWCRDAKLKIKTSSGINRFQEDKGLGPWFPRLIEIVSTMDSAQPEQAIEPSSGCSKSPDKEKFVPKPPQKRPKLAQGVQEMKEILTEVKSLIANDPTKELVEIIKEDSARQGRRDDQFLQLMSTMMQPPQPQYQPHSSHYDPNRYY